MTMNKISDQKHVMLRVDTKKIENNNVATLFFNHALSFKPGQFVTLAVNIDNKTHYRAYSISSVPQQKQLRLTIKRVPDGLVSNWLVDNLNVGDTDEPQEMT